MRRLVALVPCLHKFFSICQWGVNKARKSIKLKISFKVCVSVVVVTAAVEFIAIFDTFIATSRLIVFCYFSNLFKTRLISCNKFTRLTDTC